MMRMVRHPLVLGIEVVSAHCVWMKCGVGLSHGHKWVLVLLPMCHETVPAREATLLLGRPFLLTSVAYAVLVASVCASMAWAHVVELAKKLVAGSACVEAAPLKGLAPASWVNLQTSSSPPMLQTN